MSDDDISFELDTPLKKVLFIAIPSGIGLGAFLISPDWEGLALMFAFTMMPVLFVVLLANSSTEVSSDDSSVGE